MKKLIFTAALCGLGFGAMAQKKPTEVLKNLETKTAYYSDIAQQIWGLAEMGYQEKQSSALLQETLANAGFKITTAVAGIPTAFTAEYGNEGPVIAILGEYDALPGLSQKAIPSKESAGEKAGHACGHHLFGTASTAAAIAVKEWLEANNKKGRIRFYGCPAEEGGAAKTFMARDGLFEDVDAAICWHPATFNSVNKPISLANARIDFSFSGKAAHAATSPHLGRSALDAVELMNVGVNYMREHMPDSARIHYAYMDVGGNAANVVQSQATIRHLIRASDLTELRSLIERVYNIVR